MPLTLVPGGLLAEVLARFPHLSDHEALRVPRRQLRRVPEMLTSQLAVSSCDDLGLLVDATGVQIPGVLDDVYARAGV